MRCILKYKYWAIGLAVILLIICLPAATWLQVHKQQALPEKQWDAVYLVCGASARNSRIQALEKWYTETLNSASPPAPLILIGTDSQKSLWCGRHQTNHTVTAWAVENISDLKLTDNEHPSIIIPGKFSTTAGEMVVLADWLKKHPEIESIALVTSRYHARRALQRLKAHVSPKLTIGIIPGVAGWHNRSPLTVILEYLKIIRDSLGLSDAPIISRSRSVDHTT
jgi:hypothetical protein